MKFQIPVRSLNRRWAWTSLCAIGAFAVLAILDTRLKSATGFGTADLQRATTVDDVNLILVAWSTSRSAILAGFNLGFDYLFMPLWGFALFYGGLAARERFAPEPGTVRRLPAPPPTPNGCVSSSAWYCRSQPSQAGLFRARPNKKKQ